MLQSKNENKNFLEQILTRKYISFKNKLRFGINKKASFIEIIFDEHSSENNVKQKKIDLPKTKSALLHFPKIVGCIKKHSFFYIYYFSKTELTTNLAENQIFMKKFTSSYVYWQ